MPLTLTCLKLYTPNANIYTGLFCVCFFPLSEVKLHPLIGTLRLKQILQSQRKCFKIRFLFFNLSLWDIGKNQTFPKEAYPSPPSKFFFLNFCTILLLSSRPKPISVAGSIIFFATYAISESGFRQTSSIPMFDFRFLQRINLFYRHHIFEAIHFLLKYF